MRVDKCRIEPMKLCHVPEEYQEKAKECISRGIALTMFCGKSIIAVGGVALFWGGVGEGWALPIMNTESFEQKKRFIFEGTKNTLEDIHKKYNLHRIQATVRRDFVAGQNFLYHLGFVREGLLAKYFEDKQDGIMFALVWGK
jgi:hypothetical protein